jgi:hypothetical protein
VVPRLRARPKGFAVALWKPSRVPRLRARVRGFAIAPDNPSLAIQQMARIERKIFQKFPNVRFPAG